MPDLADHTNQPAKLGRKQVLAMLLDSSPKAWGTREEQHLQFSRALIRRGVLPVVVFSEELPEQMRNRFRAEGAEVEVINYSEGGMLHYYRELGKIVQRYSITVVHVLFFNYSSFIPWLARLNGVRRIVFYEVTSGVWRAKSWKKVLLRLRTHLVTYPIMQFVAISEHVKRNLVQAGVPEEKVVVVYNGVDTQRFAPDHSARARLVREFSIRPAEVILGTMCYFIPSKNPRVIVEAVSQLVQRGVAARLLVVGDGKMRPDLERLTQKLGVADRVHWLGVLPDPVRVLQGSDIFVLASVGGAFDLVIPEAMACEVPVVGSRSGSIPEVVQDGKTGFLATALDPASFAQAIERLAQDPALRNDMGRWGRERVRQHFTAESATENLMKVYERLL